MKTFNWRKEKTYYRVVFTGEVQFINDEGNIDKGTVFGKPYKNGGLMHQDTCYKIVSNGKVHTVREYHIENLDWKETK